MSETQASSMVIQSLIDRAKANPRAVNLLDDLIEETASSERTRLQRIKRQLLDEDIVTDGSRRRSLSTLQAIASGGESNSDPAMAALLRDAQYRALRQRLRRRLMILGVLTGVYLFTAFVAGAFLLFAMSPLTASISNIFSWTSWGEIVGTQWMRMLGFSYLALATAVIGFWGSFVLRLKSDRSWLNHWIWDNIPVIGKCLRCIDLAEACHGIASGVAVDWNYSDTFATAAGEQSGVLIRDWLEKSSDEIRNGASITSVIRRLGRQADWLGGLASLLDAAKTPESTLRIWQVTAERLHQSAVDQTERANRFLPSIVTLVAIVIAAMALFIGSSDLLRSFDVFTSVNRCFIW